MSKFVAGAALAGVVLLSTASVASEHGEEVFAEYCAACHLESLSAEAADHTDDLSAPPMNLLTTIIRKRTGNAEAAFVDHVVDFTYEPAAEKVKAMPEALDRFGLMPKIVSLYPDIERDDVEAVAVWLFGKYDYASELKELMEHQASAAGN
jgi:cytochrome c1